MAILNASPGAVGPSPRRPLGAMLDFLRLPPLPVSGMCEFPPNRLQPAVSDMLILCIIRHG